MHFFVIPMNHEKMQEIIKIIIKWNEEIIK